MEKEIDTKQAFKKLAALCSKSEHCSGEMLSKMRLWGMDKEAQAEVMALLVANKFIDDERYCRFFVNDKIKYNKWGRRKIEQALWQKQMNGDIAQKILDEIDDSEYLSVLKPLLKNKERSIKASNDYERKMKLMKFAVGRGFTMDLIRQCIDGIDDED
ncbi:MAG: RecX family transcriptional regulator [Prevotella sp.]|nr:RecX family transcriptional regulator [Prevotella sp.]